VIDLTTLFRNATSIPKRAGEMLFEAGSRGSEMYVVRSGEVGIRVGDTLVERLGPGGLVGEMALIDNSERSASAVVLQDSEVIPVDQKQFLFMVQATPFFALQVMRIMASRLRAMNKAST
jgi:CRP-like cAMP-binding protein